MQAGSLPYGESYHDPRLISTVWLAMMRKTGNGVIKQMFKKYEIYKTDKYNMLTVEVQGKTLIVREISDQWGEESHTFVSRQEMYHWAENRFRVSDYIGKEEERQAIMDAFRSF
jgi:hypothetical protein